jgi:GH25 family lysozyme M1 (1,4-beta-N-acetylmuramidase)
MQQKFVIDSLEPRLLLSRATGLDVSQFQGSINWATTKSRGISFAFVRVSHGTGYDSSYATNISGARAQGILVGEYHFGTPVFSPSNAVSQADFFLAKAKQYIVGGYLPPVLDVEQGGVATTQGRANLSTWVNDFCNRVLSITGVKPLIYCNTNYAQNYLNSTVTQWPLWIANWNGQDPQTYPSTSIGTGVWPSGSWKFWQYAADGDGLGSFYCMRSTVIDIDVYNGDTTALQSMVIGGPKVSVTYNGGTSVPDGQTTPIDFGTVPLNSPHPSFTFTIKNNGTQPLTLGKLDVPFGFNVPQDTTSPLAVGATETFTIDMSTEFLGTKSGTASFTNNDANQNPFNFNITGSVYAPDTTPPTVNTGDFNWNSGQQNVAFQISENVNASLQDSDLVLTNLDTNQVVDSSLIHAAWNSSINSAIFTFPGYASRYNALPSGNYRATLPAGSVQDAAGNATTSDYTFNFYFLDGDANRDSSVDLTDFTLMASNFNQPATTYDKGDFNYDGTVDLTDFTILAANFNATLPPAPATAAAAPRTPSSLFASTAIQLSFDDLAVDSISPSS